MDSKELEKNVYFGGRILTMNDHQPFINAVGIEGERIIAIGSLEEVKKKMKKDLKLIDLKGKTMLPGFIESHMHPITLLFFLLNVDLSFCKSLTEVQEAIIESANEKSQDELIFGHSLKEEQFDVPILPTKWDLDICTNPVFILRYDGHIGVANSKALELMGIDANTKVPDGGEIRRNENGDITGVISEEALELVYSTAAKYLMPKPDVIKKTAIKAFNFLAKKGITSIQGIFNYDKEEGGLSLVEVPIYKTIQDYILQNCYAMICTDKPKKLTRLKKKPLDGGKVDSKFKLNTLKLFLDGSFGAKTACMWEPFADAPNMCGFCVVEEDEIYEKMKSAHKLGFQIITHAIGDRANRIAVNLYKKLLDEFPKEDHRHRVEHASMLTNDVIKDMKEYGIIASCQPPFINSEYMWLEKRLGKERCKYTYPMKSIVDAGVILISGSDCPIEDPSPILGLHALVNRNGFIPEQCITIEEALKTYTINAAYGAFEEKIKGSIEIGKLADLVILDKNPLEVPNDQIKDIQVIETIIRGKSVYKQES
ncbi:MAG: amidohydrolase [Candidatus Hodarchaeota archaeon]